MVLKSRSRKVWPALRRLALGATIAWVALAATACSNPARGMDSALDPKSPTGSAYFWYFIIGNSFLYEGPDLALEFVAYTLYDTTDGTTGLTTTGNANGVVNNGETVRLAAIVRNEGKLTLNGLRWSLAGDGLLAADATAANIEFGDLAVGEYGCLVSGAAFRSLVYTDCFQGSNNSAYQTGTFRLTATSTGSGAPTLTVLDQIGNSWNVSLSVPVQ